MKKISKKTIVILSVLAVSVCMAVCFCVCYPFDRLLHEVLADERFSGDAFLELSRPADETHLPFTLNYDGSWGTPVVKMQFHDTDMYFLVDTGAEIDMLTGGLLKLYESKDAFIDEALPGFMEYMTKNQPETVAGLSEKQLRKFYEKQVRNYSIQTTIDRFWVDLNKNRKKTDGVLGMPFLRQYPRVTFDFVENMLILDDERLEGTVLPMKQMGYDCFIEFMYNGHTEYGLLDTGNYTFSPRSDFGKNEVPFTLEKSQDYSIGYDGVLKKRFPWIMTFDGIQIGDEEYSGIKGIYSNCWFSTYNKGAQNLLTVVNGIGCELFRGHVIQFDFKAMECIIR